jgi:Cdc6-like AAA superfamily ATPase
VNKAHSTEVEKTSLNTEVEDFWRSDRFSRKREVDTVIKYLLSNLEAMEQRGVSRNFVLNIDAPWGTGKTFFLKGLAQELKTNGYMVCYVNAWKTDNAEDSTVPILLEIQRTLQAEAVQSPANDKSAVTDKIKKTFLYGGTVAVHLAKGATKALGRRFLSDALETFPEFPSDGTTSDIARSIEVSGTELIAKATDTLAEKSIAVLQDQLNTTKEFKQLLSDVIASFGATNEKKKQIVVLIDELDRCRPNYAISLLERIKHIFDTSGLVFIVATDTEQLQHSVKAIYGNDFDSESYLNRFFNRKYHLKNSSFLGFVETNFRAESNRAVLSFPPGFDSAIAFVAKVFDAFQLTARDAEQCLRKLEDFCAFWPHKASIELSYLLPLLVLHHDSPILFASSIKNNIIPLMEKFAPVLRSVTINYETTFDGRNHVTTKSNLYELWHSFYRFSKYDFNQIFEELGGSRSPGNQEFVFHRLSDENAKLRGGSFSSSNIPKTILASYPEQIMHLDGFA